MKKTMHIAFSEFKKWLISPKMVLVVVMMIFVRENLIVPMQKAADSMSQPLNILEPCIASMNSGLSVLAILLCYMLMIADFPSSGGNECYYIYRAGKTSWAAGEIIFMIISAFVYLFVVIFIIGLEASPNGFWADGWSIPATDYDKSQKAGTGFIMANAISENIVTNMPPFKALIFSFFPTLLSMMLYAFIYLEGTLLGHKTIAFVIDLLLITLGCSMTAMNSKFMWLLPESHSLLQMHFKANYREYVFSPEASLCVLVGLCALFVILSAFSSRKANLLDIDRR